MDRFSNSEITKNYSVVFYMVVILLALDLWFSLKIKVRQTVERIGRTEQ